MTRVLLISELLPGYPGETIETTSYALADLALEWKKQGMDVLAIKPHWIPRDGILPPKSSLNYHGVEILRVSVFRMPRFFKYGYSGILKTLENRAFNPAIVIGHMTHSIRLGTHLKNDLEVPFLAGVHAGDLRSIKSDPDFLLPYLSKADAIWGRSEIIRRNLDKLPELKEIAKGVCLSGLNKGPDNIDGLVKKKWSKNGLNKVQFISAGNLIPLKNFDKFINALGAFKDENWSYTIFGHGPKKKEWEELVSKLDLKEKILFKGLKEKEEVLAEMEKSHFHVLPSIGETFGLAFLEAAIKGCINIGLKGSGIDGVFEKDEAVFLPSSDQAEIESLLGSIFKGNEDHLNMVKRSLNRMDSLNPEVLALNQINFIMQIL